MLIEGAVLSAIEKTRRLQFDDQISLDDIMTTLRDIEVAVDALRPEDEDSELSDLPL